MPLTSVGSSSSGSGSIGSAVFDVALRMGNIGKQIQQGIGKNITALAQTQLGGFTSRLSIVQNFALNATLALGFAFATQIPKAINVAKSSALGFASVISSLAGNAINAGKGIGSAFVSIAKNFQGVFGNLAKIGMGIGDIFNGVFKTIQLRFASVLSKLNTITPKLLSGVNIIPHVSKQIRELYNTGVFKIGEGLGGLFKQLRSSFQWIGESAAKIGANFTAAFSKISLEGIRVGAVKLFSTFGAGFQSIGKLTGNMFAQWGLAMAFLGATMPAIRNLSRAIFNPHLTPVEEWTLALMRGIDAAANRATTIFSSPEYLKKYGSSLFLDEEGILGGLSSLTGKIAQKFSTLVSTLKEKGFKAAFDELSKSASSFFSGIGTYFPKAISGIREGFSAIGDSINETMTSIRSYFKDNYSKEAAQARALEKKMEEMRIRNERAAAKAEARAAKEAARAEARAARAARRSGVSSPSVSTAVASEAVEESTAIVALTSQSTAISNSVSKPIAEGVEEGFRTGTETATKKFSTMPFGKKAAQAFHSQFVDVTEDVLKSTQSKFNELWKVAFKPGAAKLGETFSKFTGMKPNIITKGLDFVDPGSSVETPRIPAIKEFTKGSQTFNHALREGAISVLNLRQALFSFGQSLTMANQQYQTLKAEMTMVIDGLASTGMNATGVTRQNMWNKAVGLQQSVEFGALSNQIQALTIASGESKSNVNALISEILRLGKTTGRTSQAIAMTAIELTRLGFTAEQIKQSMEAIIKTSITTGIELTQVGAVIAGALNQFQLDASQSNSIADLFASVTSNSAANIIDIGEGMKFVGASAKAANQNIEDTVAIIGMLRSAGMEGGMAGTGTMAALKGLQMAAAVGLEEENLIGASGDSQLGSSVANASQRSSALKTLGLSSKDLLYADGTLRSMLEIVPKLKTQIEKLRQSSEGTAAVPVLMDALFGEQGGRTMTALIGLSEETVDKITTSARHYQDFAQRSVDIVNQGVIGKVRSMQSKMAAIAMTVGDTFKPVLYVLFDGINRAIDMFAALPKPIQMFSIALSAAMPFILVYWKGLNMLHYAGEVFTLGRKVITFALKENSLALAALKIKEVALAAAEMAGTVRTQISIRLRKILTLQYTKQLFMMDLLFLKEKAMAVITGSLSAAYSTQLLIIKRMINQTVGLVKFAGAIYGVVLAFQALTEKSKGAKVASSIDKAMQELVDKETFQKNRERNDKMFGAPSAETSTPTDEGFLSRFNIPKTPFSGVFNNLKKFGEDAINFFSDSMRKVRTILHESGGTKGNIYENIYGNVKEKGLVEGFRKSITNSFLFFKTIFFIQITAIATKLSMALLKSEVAVNGTIGQIGRSVFSFFGKMGQGVKALIDGIMGMGKTVKAVSQTVASAGKAVGSFTVNVIQNVGDKMFKLDIHKMLESIGPGIQKVTSAAAKSFSVLGTFVSNTFLKIGTLIKSHGVMGTINIFKENMVKAFLAIKTQAALMANGIKTSILSVRIVFAATLGTIVAIGVAISMLAIYALSLRSDSLSEYGRAWSFVTAEQRGAQQEMIKLEKLTRLMNERYQERNILALNYKNMSKEDFNAKASLAISQAQDEIDILKKINPENKKHREMVNDEIRMRQDQIAILRKRNFELQKGVKAEETMKFNLEQINALLEEQTFNINKNLKRRQAIIAGDMSRGKITKETGQRLNIEEELKAAREKLVADEVSIKSLEESLFGETDTETLKEAEDKLKAQGMSVYELRKDVAEKEIQLRESYVAELFSSYDKERQISGRHYDNVQNQLTEFLRKKEFSYIEYSAKASYLNKRALEEEKKLYEKQLEELNKLREQGKISDKEHETGSNEINSKIVETERRIQEERLNEIRVAVETEGALREEFRLKAVAANEEQFRSQKISLEEYNNRVRAINQINLQERQKEIQMELNMLISSFNAGELAADQYVQRRKELEESALAISEEIEQSRLDDLKSYHEQALSEVENFKEKAIAANEEQYRQGLISREAYNSRVLEIEAIMSQEVLENRKKELEALESAHKAGEVSVEGYIERRKELLSSIKDAEDELEKARMASIQDFYKKAIKEVEQFSEKERLEIKRQLVAGEIDRKEYNERIKEIDQTSMEDRKLWLEAELKAIEDNNKKGIISVEDFGSRKEEILEELGDIAEAQLDRELEKLEEVAKAYEDRLTIMSEEMSLQEALNDLALTEAEASGDSELELSKIKLEQLQLMQHMKRKELELQLEKNLATAEDIELQKQLNDLAMKQFEAQSAKEVKSAQMEVTRSARAQEGAERTDYYELEDTYIDRDVAALEKTNLLREREIELINQAKDKLQQKADIANANSQLAIQGLEQQVALADELLNLLNAGAEADKIRAEVASQLGLPAQATELEILQKKYQLQTELDAEKERQMILQHSLQDQILQSEIQQNVIAAEQAVQEAAINELKSHQAILSAEAALADARANDASKEKILALDISLKLAKEQAMLSGKQLDWAQQNVQAVKDQNAAKATALDLQQAIEQSEREATAEAADRSGRLAIATAEAKSNTEGMASAMGKVADSAGEAADEMGRAAEAAGKGRDNTSTQVMGYQKPDMEDIANRELELAAKMAEQMGNTAQAQAIRDQIAAQKHEAEMKALQEEADYLKEQRALYNSERQRFINEQMAMAQSIGRIMGISPLDTNEKVKTMVEQVYGENAMMGVNTHSKSAQLMNEALRNFNPSAIQQGNQEMQKSMESGNEKVVEGLGEVNETLKKGAARPNNIVINGSEDTGADLEKTLGALQRAQR